MASDSYENNVELFAQSHQKSDHKINQNNNSSTNGNLVANKLDTNIEINSKLEYIISWFIVLTTVYFIAASFHCLLQWLPYNNKWDLAGCIYSGLFGWISYSYGISSKSNINIYKKGLVSFVIFIVWAVTFPLLLYCFGYTG